MLRGSITLSLFFICFAIEQSFSLVAAMVVSSTAHAAAKDKTIVFVRHGCTYMNEYLSQKGCQFGSPNFSDRFENQESTTVRDRFYRDSRLSALGEHQAKSLLGKSQLPFIEKSELIVTSPLRRALQTLDLGLRPHLEHRERTFGQTIPVVAIPEAAERLYLISDVGRAVKELRKEFQYVDFDTGFTKDNHDDKTVFHHDHWWYDTSKDPKPYVEWRPNGAGQRYYCPGEPQHYFDGRMKRLLNWLQQRPENHITVVCHWGVIDWFLDADFANCQWKEVTMQDIMHKALVDEVVEKLR